MTKFVIIAIAAVGIIASLMVRIESQAALRRQEAGLREQREQLAALSAEHQHLSNLIADAAGASGADRAAELARLRRAAETLKKQTNDLARKMETSRQPQRTSPERPPKSHPPEYWEQVHQIARAKQTEARNLARAFSEYAWDHQGQSPSNFDQLTSYLAADKLTVSGTNRFEFVYQGLFDQLDGIPEVNVAVIRDTQTWQASDGRTMRVYGMGGGVGLITSSDDNFQAWEAEHIIPPPKPGQSGK